MIPHTHVWRSSDITPKKRGEGMWTYAVVVEGDGVSEPVEGRSRWDYGCSLCGVCAITLKGRLCRR